MPNDANNKLDHKDTVESSKVRKTNSDSSPAQSSSTLEKQKTSSVINQIGSDFFIDAKLRYAIPSIELIDPSTIDVILISNYLSMLALPYITQSPGFKAIIYATEPVIQFGE